MPFPKAFILITSLDNAFFLVTASETSVSLIFAIKYTAPDVSLVVLNPTEVLPAPIGVPVEEYIISSPSKNLCPSAMLILFEF